MKSVHSSDEQSHHLLETGSKTRKYPTLFKWKIATLVLSIICLLLLIAVIIMAVYLSNHPPLSKNSSFLTTVMQKTNLIASKAQFNNLYSGLYSHNSFVYGYATQVMNLTLNTTQKNLMNGFSDSSKNTLMLIELNANDGQKTVFGSYVDSSFPIPSDWFDIRPTQNYFYTFDTRSSNDRKNMLIGLSSGHTFIMNSDQQLSSCTIYKINSTQFQLLSAYTVNFETNVSKIDTQNYMCYLGNTNSTTFQGNILSLIGVTAAQLNESQVTIQMYHLSN